MDSSEAGQKTQTQPLKVEDVNRVLEVGRLLFSVLTSDEVNDLQTELAKCSHCLEIGNAGDS